MSSDPLVSVVMPTHNYGEFVGKAIESILGQTYEKLELIVVDDASTDHTPELLASFRDDRMSVIRRAESGCSGVWARNDGMRAARGELMAVADSDDVSLADRIEAQVDHLVRHPDVDVVGTGLVAVTPSGSPLGPPVMKPRYPDPATYREELLSGETPILHQTMMFRRTILDRIDGYGPFLSSGDTEFLIRASRHFSFDNVDRVLVRARKHRTSVTSRTGNRLKRSHRRLFLEREYIWANREIERLKGRAS